MSHRWPLALRPSNRPWAIAAGVRGAVAAGLIAGFGVITDQMTAVGLMYFGAACSVAFAIGVTSRIRLIGVASQASGAAVGLLIGTFSTPTTAAMIGAAAAAAFCSGAIGRIGPQSAAFATMLVIGVAFAQFSGIELEGITQIGWYCTGSVIVGIATLPMPRLGRLVEERALIAEVFEASADLMAATGTPLANDARTQLAAASAAARTAWYDNRWSATFEHKPRYRELASQLRSAQSVALAAAAAYRAGDPPAAPNVDAVRNQGRRLLSATATEPPVSSANAWVEPSTTAHAHHARPDDALAVLTTKASLLAGTRLMICMTVATGATLLLHDPAHSFWLPLTVAVVVRPEYASVYVRTVNRVAGTLVGAAVATIPLLVFGSGWPIAVTAALAVGFAAAAAPKLYGLSVIGITCSALLSTSIAVADPVAPMFRLLDTALGCFIAIVFGYLLWPRRYSPPDGLNAEEAVNAAADYLRTVEQLARTQPDIDAFNGARDRAYRTAHRFRSAAQAALADPPPTRTIAASILPAALHLEDLVDDITAIAQQPDQAATPRGTDHIRAQLEQLAAKHVN